MPPERVRRAEARRRLTPVGAAARVSFPLRQPANWRTTGSPRATPGRSDCRLPDQAKLPSGRRTSISPAPAGSQNRTARCYLHACHAARVERDQPVAVAAAEDPRLLAQNLDDLLDHLILINLVGIFVGQVRVLAPEEPNTEHDSCHAGTVVRPRAAPPSPAPRTPDEPSVTSRWPPTRHQGRTCCTRTKAHPPRPSRHGRFSKPRRSCTTSRTPRQSHSEPERSFARAGSVKTNVTMSTTTPTKAGKPDRDDIRYVNTSGLRVNPRGRPSPRPRRSPPALRRTSMMRCTKVRHTGACPRCS